VYTVRVEVSDALGVRVNLSQIVEVYSLPTVSSVTLWPTEVDLGQPLTLAVASTGGASALGYSYRGLPPGCTSVNTPELVCTPEASGLFDVEVQAQDVNGVYGTAETTVVVNPPLTVSDFWASPDGLGLGGSTQLTVLAENGTAPYVYAYPSLPPGCDGSDRSTIVCQPNTTGSFTVEVSVTDASGVTVTSTLVLSVYVSAPIVQPPHHPVSPVQPPTNYTTPASPRPLGSLLEVGIIALLVTALSVHAYRGRLRRSRRRTPRPGLFDRWTARLTRGWRPPESDGRRRRTATGPVGRGPRGPPR
jgi:hypothetical protein